MKDCTHILSELRLVKDAEEIERIQAAAKVADVGMAAAVEAVMPGGCRGRVRDATGWGRRVLAHLRRVRGRAQILPTGYLHGGSCKKVIW